MCLLTSPFFFSRPDLSVLYGHFLKNLLVSIELTLVTNLLYTVFLTASLSTTYVVYLNQQEQFLVSLRNGVLFVLALSDTGGVLAWVAC